MRQAGEILTAFNALPLVGIDTILQGRRALILAPHPDDESLGCGGLIAASCAAGLPPAIAILTNGSASHPGSLTYPPKRLAALRKSEARRAVQILGLPEDNLYCLNFEDTKLPCAGEDFVNAVAALTDIALTHDCGLVAGPWVHDPHCDHEAGAAIAAAVAEATRLPLLSYPIWGWLTPPETLVPEQRRRGWRLDVTNYLPAKRQAIAAHASQYGALINDAPNGFQLPDTLLQIFDRPYEVFITA